MRIMKRAASFRNVLFLIVILVLIASTPFALTQDYHSGAIYIFSRQFLEDLPRRFTGPGRLRFIIQPLVAIALGIRAGAADAHSGHRPFIVRIITEPQHRSTLLCDGFSQLAVLIAMAILLDAVSQFLIYKEVHPGAAVIVGPVLIAVPYAISRALGNRYFSQLRKSRP